MATLKIQKKASVSVFLSSITDEEKRRYAKALLKGFKAATGMKPTMWGGSIIGFGSYHYKYASGREGDWMLTGFSPRKAQLSVYIMPGFKNYEALLKQLGTYKISGGSCLYIKRLADVDTTVLEELIAKSVADMQAAYDTTAS